MARYFNTEGICKPKEHYMVRLDARLRTIKELYVDRGKYFVINRGRQYGKTTTLRALAEFLKDEYIVFFMDFQMMSTACFADEKTFAVKLIGQMERVYSRRKEMMRGMNENAFQELQLLKGREELSMDILFVHFSKLCETSEKPIVLIIDEVDSASNHQVFLDFLAQFRGCYLDRESNPIFHSVILAGVYDIKNLKLKLRPDEDRQYNSPWNIAADFNIDMSFSSGQIEDMLGEYEADHHTGMDAAVIAEEIYQYTSGYPYLVSAVCKMMDEKLPCQQDDAGRRCVWTREGVGEAVKVIMQSKTSLFDSMIKHLADYPDLKKLLYAMLLQGEQVAYNQYHHTIELARMFGYVREAGMYVQVANRMFEICLYNLFLSEEELASVMSRLAKQNRNQFVSGGRRADKRCRTNGCCCGLCGRAVYYRDEDMEGE